MGLAVMVVLAVPRALYERPKAFHRIRVNDAICVSLGVFNDGATHLPADRIVTGQFVSYE
jgi:hypothetical protein